jgi:hypothetical protein
MKRALVLLTVSAIAFPASARAASDDWDIVRDPAKKSVLAFTSFDNGLSVGFRCVDGSFHAVITGLPPSQEGRRMLELQFRDAESRPTMWTATTNASTVLGDLPAPLAREFRQGGSLGLTVPNGAADGRNLRYQVDLPASGAAVDEALTACGRPLVDPRDRDLEAIGATGLSGGLAWHRLPRPDFPFPPRYTEGFAVLTCMTTPTGTVRDCVVEMEHPHDGGFGRAAVKGAERSRIQNAGEPGQPVPVRRFSFLTNFRMVQ